MFNFRYSVFYSFLLFLLPFVFQAQWHIQQSNVPHLIDFDTVVPGVLNGPYTAAGYSPSAIAGFLNSNAWSVYGFSSGSVGFGDSAVGGDFGRGLSSGGVSTGGLYSVDWGSGGQSNVALGVQAGGSDFTPGYHLLRCINATNDTISRIHASYIILEYNDQGRSSIIEFSVGADPLNLNHIQSLDYATSETADSIPVWNKIARQTDINLIVFPGDTFYLKWHSDDYSGSGSRDEWAFDSVVVVLDPPLIAGPSFDSLVTIPEDPEAGEDIHIACNAFDSDGVDSVWIRWGVDSLNLTNAYSMLMQSPNSYISTQVIPGQVDSTWIYFRLFATDQLANKDSSELRGILVHDSLYHPDAGDLIITELMINPSAVSDARGEYMELFNPTDKNLNLEQLRLMDSSGDSTSINDRVVIRPGAFTVLARNGDSLLNGGFKPDYTYSGFTLSNLNDQVYLININGDTIDKLEYTASSVWLGGGAAVSFGGAVHQDNNDSKLWAATTFRQQGYIGTAGDFGSPGFSGSDQVVDQMVFVDGNWSFEPDSTTINRKGLIRSGSVAVLNQNAEFSTLRVESSAVLDNSGYVVKVRDSLTLEADSSGSANIIGKVDGLVKWQHWLESPSASRWFNLSIPMNTTLDSVRIDEGGKVNCLLDQNGDTTKVNIWKYESATLNPSTGEGTWLPVVNKQQSTLGVGFSLYSGAPHFGNLPQKLTAYGTINNTDQQLPLGSVPGVNQYNFIGNPFPCAIDWDQVCADNPGLNKTYFIYNDGPDSSWVFYNSASGVGHGVNELIASGQAFFVNGNGLSSFEIKADTRNLNSMLNPVKKVLPPGIGMTSKTSQGRTDFTYIGFANGATDSLDREIDATKKPNPSNGTPSIFSFDGIHQYAYNFMPIPRSVISIPIQMNLNVSSAVSLEFQHINIDPSWGLELEDLTENIRHKLNTGPYTFNHLLPNKTRNFILHINPAVFGEKGEVQKLSMIRLNDQLVHQCRNLHYPVTVKLFDLSGKIVYNSKLEASGILEIEKEDLKQGIYVLLISEMDGGADIRKKVWVD